MDKGTQAQATDDFSLRKGEVLLNRKVVENRRNVQFFAALFTDFVPVAVRDIGKGRLVYTGCSMAFRALAPGEKPPRYHLAVSMSSATGGAWKCDFTELERKPAAGFLARLFGRKKKGEKKQEAKA